MSYNSKILEPNNPSLEPNNIFLRNQIQLQLKIYTRIPGNHFDMALYKI